MEKFLGADFCKKMNCRRAAVFVFFFFVFAFLSAQNDTVVLKKIRTIPLAAKSISVDPFENIFIVTPENEIVKYDAGGREQFRYSNNRLGEISIFDATSPFNLLAFFPEFNLVQTFDRTLSPTGEFRLFEAGIAQSGALSISSDNNIWLFDDANFSLKKLDKEGRLLLESGNLNLILGHPIEPVFVAERDNFVYLWEPAGGLFVFDIFAKFIRRLPTPEGAQSPFLFQNYFCHYRPKGEIFCEETTAPFSSFSIPLENAPAFPSGLQMHANRVFLSSETGVEIFEIVKK